MRRSLLWRGIPLAAASILSSMSILSISACARPHEYYDTIYSDRHRWDEREETAYRRWELERRFEHIAFERRREEEQREYWRWRHDHPDDRR
jgi:hypothetical protein